MQYKMYNRTIQVAQLWQRDQAKLDMFSINVQRYSQNHALVFGSPYDGIRAMYALYLKVLTQRNFEAEFHRENVSFTRKTANEPLFIGGLRGNVSDSSLARWNARSRLPIGYN